MDISAMDMYGCEKKVSSYMNISDMDIPYGAIPQSRNQLKSLIEKKLLGFLMKIRSRSG